MNDLNLPSHSLSPTGKGDITEEEDRILRVVTQEELDWIGAVLAGIKNKGDGWGEITIILKRGRIYKVKDAGEQMPDIYKD